MNQNIFLNNKFLWNNKLFKKQLIYLFNNTLSKNGNLKLGNISNMLKQKIRYSYMVVEEQEYWTIYVVFKSNIKEKKTRIFIILSIKNTQSRKIYNNLVFSQMIFTSCTLLIKYELDD